MNEIPREARDRQATLLDQRGWIFAVVIAAVGLLIRLPGTFEWWLNPDEGIYYSMVTWSDFARFWKQVPPNAHPPLFYFVIRGVGLVTEGFVAIRLLSVVFGAVAIYVAWLAGREVATSDRSGTATGLLSAALVAVSPGAIVMSQVIRPYMMQLTFLLLALYQLLRFRRQKQSPNLAWYSVFLSLSLLTHYSSFLAFGTFAILILCDFAAGKFGRRSLPRLLTAHLAPGLIGLGLYAFHLRPHVIGSDVANEALEGWLANLMVYSIEDVGARLWGFMGYLVGAPLAGPAVLIWIAGLAMALWKRSWTPLILSLGAFGVAVFAATMGQYPFGACRHTTWLMAFFVYPLAMTLGEIVVPKYRTRTAAIATILVLGFAGVTLDRKIVRQRTRTRPLPEHVLKTSDIAKARPILTNTAGSNILLMGRQCYFLLLPFYVDERETAENSSDGTFLRFQWASREVLVLRYWDFSARAEHIGEPDHLYTFVNNVDRLMPQLGLGNRHEVLLLFGGWSHKTPRLLQSIDKSLPPNARFIVSREHVAGLTALVMDIARYRLVVEETFED